MYTLYLNNVAQIRKEMLEKLEVKVLLLDIDNTIKIYGENKPYKGVLEWIKYIKDSGYEIVLISNNYKETVEPFAKSLGLKYIAFALKPSPLGYVRAKKLINQKFSNMLVIGDQVFTDIFGAKIVGIKSILVDPISKTQEGVTVKIRRVATSYAEKKIKSRGLYTIEE